MLLIHSWMCDHPLELGQPTRSNILKKKMDSHFPRSYPLLIAPQMQMGCPGHLLFHYGLLVCLEIVQDLCMLSSLLWVHLCNCPPMARNHPFLIAASTSAGSHLLPPLLQWSLSLGSKGHDIDVPFRDEHPTIFKYFSLLTVVGFLLITIHCK